MIESTLTFRSTIKTLEYFNQKLFSAKGRDLGFMADAGEESDHSDEDDIMRALRRPELDRETEVNTSLDEENLSALTLMPLATLMPLPRAEDTALPVSSEPTYVDVSDNEPSAIQNSEVDQAPGGGVSVVFAGPPAQETITKPTRGRGRGSKKPPSGRGKVNRGGAKGRGTGASVRAPGDSAATAPKAPGGRQLRARGGNKQNVEHSGSLADNLDLDESIEEDFEYSAANIH